jgi:hypothetical protein
MSSSDKKKGGWKQKIFHEMFEYWMNFFYLAIMFAAFMAYRRLILAAHDIIYTDYGIAVIEAAILAKVIMIGGVFRLGRGLEKKPLLLSTLYKTVVFILFVGAFKFIEHMIKGLSQGKGLMQGLADHFGKGHHELLANLLIMFVAFIPFFAFKELGRVLGEGRVWELFFRRRADQ